VIDFDFYNPPAAAADVQGAWLKLQCGPPVVWTEKNGGHWIATRGAAINEVQSNLDLFSYNGLTIPRSSTPSLPIELDPPEHGPFRALINGFINAGRCEFEADFARRVPIGIFLKLVDLPLTDRDYLLGLAETRVRNADPKARDGAKAALMTYLADKVQSRRLNPGKDFISRIVTGSVNGRALTDDETRNLLITIMTGGLDTVASMMGFIMNFLATHAEHRRKLAGMAEIPTNVVNEFVRRFGLVNTARTIKKDVEFYGAPLHAGEQICCPNWLYGLDDNIFEDPVTVDFDRANAGQHVTFGAGVHRCPGANLGRLEVKFMLEEWIRRIPDFWIADGMKPIFQSGLVNTVNSLPLQWTETR
jgi:cytochrome P450